MTRRAGWFVPSLLVLAFAAPASAGPWNLAPGQWYSEFRAGTFTADSWHNDDGDRLPLYGGGTFEQRSLVSYNELGWKKRVNFLLAIPIQSVTRRASQSPFQRTETGLGDARIGFRYRLAGGATAMAIEAEWKAPLGYNRTLLATHQDSILAGDANGDGDSLNIDALRQSVPPRLGEGQQDLGIGLSLGTSLPAFHGYMQAFGGYRHRFDEPADQIVANAELGIWVTRRLMLGGRYEGELASGKGNEKADEITRHRVGPRLLYRVDDSLDLVVQSLHTALANNAFHTDEVYVGVAFKRSTLNRLQGALGSTASP